MYVTFIVSCCSVSNTIIIIPTLGYGGHWPLVGCVQLLHDNYIYDVFLYNAHYLYSIHVHHVMQRKKEGGLLVQQASPFTKEGSGVMPICELFQHFCSTHGYATKT